MTRPDTFTEVEAVSDDIVIPRLSVGAALKDMKHEVRLFTPALLITHGRFDRDPVKEFDARFPPEKTTARPFVIDLQRENEFFFRGLGVVSLNAAARPINWDKRLYGIDASRADECFEFLGGIAFSDPKTNYYASVFSYDLRVQDPTSKISMPLTVKVFCVLANSFIAYFANDYVAPRAVKRATTKEFNISNFAAADSLLVNQVTDDPLKMRDE